MQIKQAQLTDYQDNGYSLANQTVELLDRLEARRRDPSRSLLIEERHSRRTKSLINGSDATLRFDTTSPKPNVEVQIIHLNREVDAARKLADRMVQPWQADNELKLALHSKRLIDASRHADEEALARAIKNAETRLTRAQAHVDAVGCSKYAQTVRALRDYAVAIEKQIHSECEAKTRATLAKHCVIDLENMVRSVKNLEKGANGDLPVIDVKATFDPFARLTILKEHLDDKITRINSNQDRRLDRLVELNEILSDLQRNLNNLPGDAAIFFFNRDGEILKAPMSKPGNILVGTDRQEYPKSKLRPDGTFLNRDGQPVKVEMTYKVIDVPRWKNFGNGPNGAGMDRFAGDDIAGAAIVRPKDGAKPIQTNKRVFVEKEVVATTGDVPEEVIAGLSFKQMAKKYGTMEYAKK